MWLPCMGSCMQLVATMGPLASTGSSRGQGRVAFQSWLSRCGCTRTAGVLPVRSQGAPCLRSPGSPIPWPAQWHDLSSLGSFPQGRGWTQVDTCPALSRQPMAHVYPAWPCFQLQWPLCFLPTPCPFPASWCMLFSLHRALSPSQPLPLPSLGPNPHSPFRS